MNGSSPTPGPYDDLWDVTGPVGDESLAGSGYSFHVINSLRRDPEPRRGEYSVTLLERQWDSPLLR